MTIIRWSRFVVLATAVAASSILLAAPPKTTTGQTVQKAPATSAATAARPQVKPTIVTHPMPAGFHPGIPVTPDHPGVHINSVKIEGACGQPATFVVEIQNNLTVVARLGDILIQGKNEVSNQSARSPFRNLNPAEKRTIRIPTTFAIWCQGGELAGSFCYEVSIVMEPDNVSAGQVWDRVFHTACAGTPTTGQVPAVSDTPHK